jgi:hypothetical protein
MAIFEQMREQISPQEFTNEMLAGAEQVDPQTVAQFKQGLEGLSLPMEILDAINDLMDEVLENPADYQELRSYYISEGVPEDLLPEQFDPEFFAAFNMAVDQMLAEPTGVQAFAKGGIAELKPIAKAIASYGRDGDTMLAHITPAEARMLRRRGGSGTINPDTGLPEFKKWYKKLGDAITKPFKAVAKAVKSVVSKVAKEVKRFAKSTVGKMVLTVALGFFLGPAAASMLGVTSTAGVAAVGGFIGSAGSTLAAGGNLKDALKAGAVGGLTAGAGAGIMGGTGAFQAGSYTGPTTVGGQFDRFTDALGFGTRPPGDLAPVVDAPAPVPGAGADAASIGPGMAPTPQGVAPPDALGDFIQQNDAARMAANTPANLAPVETLAGTPNPNYTGLNRAGTGAAPTVRESFSKMGEGLGMGEGPASFDTFKKGATDLFAPGGPSSEQLNARAAELVGKTPGLPWNTALKQATNELAPGILRTYGPAAAAGLGIMGLAGGFQTKQPQLSETAQDLLDRDKDRPTIQERPDLFYLQNMPGVKYDERGAIIGSTPWSPSATMDDVRVPAQPSMGGAAPGMGGAAPGMGMPQPFPPAMYTPAMGALGQQQQVAQPFNNPYMYSNLMQPRYAEGGLAYLAQGGYPRRTGQISGPGTEKSDSIPAMLSDGEFVMTAKAVRGAGKGSRRAGAKKMYDLMHQLERNASRG